MALAPQASDPARSRGRRHPEPADPTRQDFQRDRDRIVHSTAFRRLVYKTQVFLNHEGDLFRTRLTHSLEVAQLGRSMARMLGLHEDLVEAIALAHDLGHTPFGHAGQDALNQCMSEHGGFEHNLQSLRVVDGLEHRYPHFDGLNLCFETREGILKHCSRANALRLNQAEPQGVAQRFLDGTQPSLEAQLCNLADSIAYNAHDIDDGVRSGLLSLDQMLEAPLFSGYLQAVMQQHPQLSAQPRRWLFEATRRMLSDQVHDVVRATRAAIQDAGVVDLEQVRHSAPLVRFSDDMHRSSSELKRFLFQHLYRHDQVMRMTDLARQVVSELFQAYNSDPNQMRAEFAQRIDTQRAISDYIAGMTDRFAHREHERLTGHKLW
jgi:dGTPase